MKHIVIVLVVVLLVAVVLTACMPKQAAPTEQAVAAEVVEPEEMKEIDVNNLHDIYLAGGCFWGVEEFFSRIEGVYEVTSGYANGDIGDPTYQQVIAGSGHAETVHIMYDPKIVDLQSLLIYYFRIIEPTSVNKQGNDVGIQYRTGIYYVDEADVRVIDAVMAHEQTKHDEPIVVEVGPLVAYYLAEEYHQDYLVKNPNGYCHVNFNNLEAPIEKITIPGNSGYVDGQLFIDPNDYPKPGDADIRAMLTPQQFNVTQNGATEHAFANEFFDNHAAGIYVDVVTGEPLFASVDKYESGCGWPSFVKAINEDVVTFIEDTSFNMVRIEVRSRIGDSHLGHVFDDGPKDRGGKRYCINSAAIRFIAKDDLEAEGYGYLSHLAVAY